MNGRDWRKMLIVAVPIVLLLLVLSSTYSASYQTCQTERAENYRAIHQRDYFYAIAAFWVCEGVVLDDNSELLTAIATIVMAAFTGTLWWATSSTAELTRQTVGLAEKQFLLEGRQADLAEKQHELARLQHIAANKPSLRIRSIVLFPPYTGAKGYFVKGHHIRGSLVVANSGATDAKIIDSGYRFYWADDGLPMRPPLEKGEVDELLLTDDPIVGYGSRGTVIQSRMVLNDDFSFRSHIAGGARLYLFGFIHYADIDGAERFAGFCRQYDTAEAFGREGHFITLQNHDYEYSD